MRTEERLFIDCSGPDMQPYVRERLAQHGIDSEPQVRCALLPSGLAIAIPDERGLYVDILKIGEDGQLRTASGSVEHLLRWLLKAPTPDWMETLQ
jgi:hypothetical protein